MTQQVNPVEIEREIDLKLALTNILKKRVQILCFSIILAFLFAGAKGIYYYQNIASLEATYEADLNSYNNQKGAYESGISSLQSSLSSISQYTENSIYYNLNPYNEVETKTTLFISPQNESNIEESKLNQITQGYFSFISNIDYSQLADKMGIESQYLKELVQSTIDYNADTVQISVVGNDAKMTEEIANYIVGELKNKDHDFTNQFGQFDVTINSIATDNNVDVSQLPSSYDITNNGNNNLLSKQSSLAVAVTTEITNINTNIDTMQKALDKLSKPTEVQQSAISSIIKQGIIGLVFGIFLGALIYIIRYILSNTVTSEMELQKVYNYKNLAIFPMKAGEGKVRRTDKFIYEVIDSSFGEGTDVAAEKAKLNVTACRNENKKLIYVCVGVQQRLNELDKTIAKINGDNDYLITTNLNSTADELEKLKDADAVVIVVERYSTNYKNLTNVIETINNWGKPVIGSITF